MIRIGNHLLAAAALLAAAWAQAHEVARFADSGAGLNTPVTSPVTGQPAGDSGYLVQSMAFQIDKSPAVRADDEKANAAGLTVDGGAVGRV